MDNPLYHILALKKKKKQQYYPLKFRKNNINCLKILISCAIISQLFPICKGPLYVDHSEITKRLCETQ